VGCEKVLCSCTKAAISLKRVKIEEKLVVQRHRRTCDPKTALCAIVHRGNMKERAKTAQAWALRQHESARNADVLTY